MYSIKYLPIAWRDLRSIVDYITNVLKAPKAARDLVDALDDSISSLAAFLYMGKVYQSEHSLSHEYRVLPVKNYLVFYVISHNEVEIHRVLLARMDLEKHIK